jgi:transcriptional antiterminator NusG
MSERLNNEKDYLDDDASASEASYVPGDHHDEDSLEEDQGVSSEEIHPEAEGDLADDGVHSFTQEEGAPEPEAAEHAPGPQEPADPAHTKHWYIIHAYSGFENKVAESLRTRAQAFGFADRLGQVLIPTEEVIELRNGKKVTSKRLLYPGYVLVEMEMDDELWHAVKDTPRVTGFVGGGTKPVPLTADEVNAVLYRQASSAERPRPKMTFEKNEMVKIIDGPFTNFSGKVDDVNTERNTLRVMVTIFGRSTPVELDFLQVEKI